MKALLKVFLVGVFLPCCKPEPKPSVCGCKGDKTADINGTFAVSVASRGNNIFFSIEKGFLISCDSTTNYTDGQIFHLTGQVRSSCIRQLFDSIKLDPPLKGGYLQAASLIPYNDLQLNQPISWGDFVITIIRSEDYGYDKGYGFTLLKVSNGFKILAPYLPIGHFRVCHSKSDAFKFACLYLYQLVAFPSDLPDVTEQQIYYTNLP